MAAKSQNFQLPEFTPINFSLTDGTDIPPPPDSPVDEPRPPTPGCGPLSSHPTTPRAGAFPQDALSVGANSSTAPLDRQATNATNDHSVSSSSSPPKHSVSPTASKRPSSVRRFLGIRGLGSTENLHSDSAKNRPMSPQSVQTQASSAESHRSLSRKKSTSWFGKRKSMMFIAKVDEQPAEPPKENGAVKEHQAPQRRGPPPPSIPEFAALGSILGKEMDADDMFKNIK